jgi:hypothetical protein
MRNNSLFLVLVASLTLGCTGSFDISPIHAAARRAKEKESEWSKKDSSTSLWRRGSSQAVLNSLRFKLSDINVSDVAFAKQYAKAVVSTGRVVGNYVPLANNCASFTYDDTQVLACARGDEGFVWKCNAVNNDERAVETCKSELRSSYENF